MIFMGVRHDKAGKPVQLIQRKGGIRRHHIDTGRRIVAKGDAHIDHQPVTIMAIKAHIHADFARAAQRDEHHFVRAHAVFRA